jgi:hypothetical protein
VNCPASSLRRNHERGDEIAEIVMSHLVGWLDEADAAQQLGMGTSELRSTLKHLGLADAAMMPCSIDHGQSITYADLAGQDFTLPRYDDVVDALRDLAGREKPRCFSLKPSDHPTAMQSSGSALPNGIIFHVGRCGSTLLCQLLERLVGCITIKEPEVINRLLVQWMDPQRHFGIDDFDRIFLGMLRSFAFAAGRARTDRQVGCVIKMSSWNLLALGDIVGRLGDVPKILLVRDPVVTVASMIANPPDWYVSSQENANCEPLEKVGLFATEWVKIVEAALRLQPSPLIIDYESLVADPWGSVCAIARHCSLPIAPRKPGAAIIKQAVLGYSKSREHENYDPKGRHWRQKLSVSERAVVAERTSDARARLSELKPNLQSQPD